MPPESRAQQQAQERRARVPTGGARKVLDAKRREGFVPRYVLDNPGRIAQMRDHGYEMADPKNYGGATSTDMGSNISVHAGGETARRLVLMEQRQDFYEQDQAAKQAALDATMELVAAGKPEGEGASREGRQYVPERGIRIERR